MKTRDALMRWLAKRIDKIIVVAGYCVLFLLLLKLVPGVLYQNKLAEVGIWQETREIKNDHFIVRYAMSSGDNKPTILSPSDDELLAVNGWESTITVDNSPRSFWDHTFRSYATEDLVRHNMGWENYQLMQTSTLCDNYLTIAYKFYSYDNAHLTLNLKHRYENYSLLIWDNVAVNQQRAAVQPKYRVDVGLSFSENAQHVWDNAPYWVNLTCSLDNIRENQWCQIAQLTISYSTLTQ